MRPARIPVFAESEVRPRVNFFTSSVTKFLHARSVFDICRLPLTHFRSRQEPYDEVYEFGRTALLQSAVEQVAGLVGRKTLFFVEDTSIRIAALSTDDVGFPGLAAKEWFAATRFEDLDAELKKRGDRSAVVRSDIALHVPGVPEPLLFEGSTQGRVAEMAPDFLPRPEHPWLTPDTFNGWFIPDGATIPLGAMTFEQSWEFDFRVKALMHLIAKLAEFTYVLNLPTSAYERVTRVPAHDGGQVELFPEDRPSKRAILMVTGHTCAGKTEFGMVAEALSHAHHIEASEVLRGCATEEERREHEGFALANAVLTRLGADAVARRIVEKELPYTYHEIVVITGFRTIEEVAYVKRHFHDARLLVLMADRRTRYQRQIQRKRPGFVEGIDRFDDRDCEQESFGLLVVSTILADDLLENDGTSDQSLDDFRNRVRALLSGASKVAGLTRDQRPRHDLEHERLYRCLRAIEQAGVPLSAPEISEITNEMGVGIAQRNVNQALREFPQFAARKHSRGENIRYEMTRAGLAYVRQREVKERSMPSPKAPESDVEGETDEAAG